MRRISGRKGDTRIQFEFASANQRDPLQSVMGARQYLEMFCPNLFCKRIQSQREMYINDAGRQIGLWAALCGLDTINTSV